MSVKQLLLGFIAAVGGIVTNAQAQMDMVKPDSVLSHPRNGFVRTPDYNIFSNMDDSSAPLPLCIVSYTYNNASEKYPVFKHVRASGVDTNGDNKLSRDEILNIDYSFYDPGKNIGFGVAVNNEKATYTKSDPKQGGICDKRFTRASYKIDEIRESILESVFGTPPKHETHPELNPFRM